jgi:type II secretory pathway component PulF
MGDEDPNVAVHPMAVLVRRELSADDLVTLNEELAGLARAGLPLDQGLAALARDMYRGRLKQVTEDLAADLRAGHTLPEALTRQQGRLPAYYAALVTAGVRSGRIDQVLATLTSYARALSELRATVISAVLYPTLVFVLGLGILTAVAYYLIPHFEKTFVEMRLELPAASKLAFAAAHEPLQFIVLPPVLLVVLLFTARLLLGLSERGRRAWARWIYAIPLVGRLLRSARLASFTDLLAILVEHEVPLPEAFHLAGAASSDVLAASASREVEKELRDGRDLAAALKGRSEFPAAFSWMAGMGARRGSLATTLRSEADRYRRQAEARAALLRSVLPPAFIILIALIIVGVFGVAIFLPLLNLLESLGMRI